MGRRNNTNVKMIFAAMVAICGCNLIASPIDDLASPSQETRDAAAKILRATYTPPSRANWDSLVASIKIGDNKTNVIEMLRRLNIKEGGGAGTGTYESLGFPLDDLWELELSSEGNRIVGCKLHEQMRNVWVGPTNNFSGAWTTYWVNGQRQSEIHYKDGKYFGEFTGFYSDGKKAYVQHYDHQIGEGADTGYFPSGKIKYQGQYRTNVQVGTWVWYNEDGTTNSVKDFSKL